MTDLIALSMSTRTSLEGVDAKNELCQVETDQQLLSFELTLGMESTSLAEHSCTKEVFGAPLDPSTFLSSPESSCDKRDDIANCTRKIGPNVSDAHHTVMERSLKEKKPMSIEMSSPLGCCGSFTDAEKDVKAGNSTTEKSEKELLARCLVSELESDQMLSDSADSFSLSKSNLFEVIGFIKQAKHKITSLQAERDGLVDIVNAVTSAGSDRSTDAIAQAAVSDGRATGTLPLHVVQMLETIPWDERARKHTSFTEEVYEWQFYTKQKGWKKELSCFPPCILKSLPVIKPVVATLQTVPDGDCPSPPSAQESSPSAAGVTLLPGGCVITDSSTSRIMNLDGGYPLPSEGTWNWVGGWSVDREEGIPCDTDGWSYASEAEHLASREQSECFKCAGRAIYDEYGADYLRRFRFRKWTRRRVLLSYPCIGDKAKNFLALAAQNASLAVSLNKLSNRLLDTQLNLAEKEEKLASNQELEEQLYCLLEVVKEKDKRLQKLEQENIMRTASERSLRLRSGRPPLCKIDAVFSNDERYADDTASLSTSLSSESSTTASTYPSTTQMPIQAKDILNWTRIRNSSIFGKTRTRSPAPTPAAIISNNVVDARSVTNYVIHQGDDCRTLTEDRVGIERTTTMGPSDSVCHVVDTSSDMKAEEDQNNGCWDEGNFNAGAFVGDGGFVARSVPSFDQERDRWRGIESEIDCMPGWLDRPSMKVANSNAYALSVAGQDVGKYCLAYAATDLSDREREEIFLWTRQEPDFEC